MGDDNMDMEVGMDDQDEMEGTYMEAKAADKAAAMKDIKKDVKKDAKKMTEAEWIREYVEKVSAPSNQEGADNTKAVVAPKNDMGGKVVGGSPEARAGCAGVNARRALARQSMCTHIYTADMNAPP